MLGTGLESPVHVLATQAAVASFRSGKVGEGTLWGPERVAAQREWGVLWPSVKDPSQFVARRKTSKDPESRHTAPDRRDLIGMDRTRHPAGPTLFRCHGPHTASQHVGPLRSHSLCSFTTVASN